MGVVSVGRLGVDMLYGMRELQLHVTRIIGVITTAVKTYLFGQR